MQDATSAGAQDIFTIGHSNHPLQTFLGLLTAHHIDVVIDVRSQPRSRYSPHFSLASLKPAVTAHGLVYIFLGKELGGRPDAAEYYDAEGYVLYSRLARSAGFLAGIDRVQAAAGTGRPVIMCSEENPSACHRRLLIGRVLAARGMAVSHIRGTGALQTERELRVAEAKGQLALFAPPEEPAWRSTRSVSRRKPPPTSSKH